MFRSLLVCLVLALPIASQQIQDVWTTSSDKSSLFVYQSLAQDPISFVDGNTQPDITVDPTTVLQEMIGFGGAMTDSSAKLLSELKSSNPNNYWQLLNYMFNSTDGADAAGMTYLRVPLGASDFSDNDYTYDDTANDVSLAQFNVDTAPDYLFSTIQDVMSVNSIIKIHLCPWSPPGWMKDSGSINGGKFTASYTKPYAQYLLKSLQGFKAKGITAYAIGIQNEPQNDNDSYPTAIIIPSLEAKVAGELRALMNSNGFTDTIILGYEHNWSGADGYATEVIADDTANALAGVSFHCYNGSVEDQDEFSSKYPTKDIYFTECTGMFYSDFWQDLQWYMNNIFIGAVNHGSKNGAMWNLVLNGTGEPRLPGTTSCGGADPCRGVVTLSSDGSYTPNQEFYAIAQASKAAIPKDEGGPFGQRVGSSVNSNTGLVVTAYVTNRTSSTDWPRYSLVVLNPGDATTANIGFQGKTAEYNFTSGVTTLGWYAAPN